CGERCDAPPQEVQAPRGASNLCVRRAALNCVMPALGLSHHHPRRNVRLDTLVRLRWLAIIGQTTAVLVVYYGLDFELPIYACLAVIALAAWLNVALRVRFGMTQRIEPDRAAWLLAFDIAELAILVFLTGGLP